MKLYIFLGFILNTYISISQQLIQPFLQNLSPNQVTIVWEAVSCDSGVLEWGETTLDNSEIPSTIETPDNSCIFSANIQNLLPNTLYNYKAVNGVYSSKVLSFITPSLALDEMSTRLIAISDMQKDSRHPDVFDKVINEGIIHHLESNYNGSLSYNLQMVLIPGDLVDNGNNHNEWIDDFFASGENLFSYVPIYPVLGNHENNTSYFFDYFDLPKNGSANYKEHWWFKDHSNIRIIGMDSNWDYQIQTQLDWLDSVLNITSSDTLIDFVFAQLHHPHKSELWPEGNTDFTGMVIEKLESFTEFSGKPSVHFFGHTHGYSRGQSKNHKHLMVNVASGGGNIDYWNEYFQEDYEEYSISQDEYGFVIVEIKAGENPYFIMKRFSMGDQYDSKNNSLEDSICIKLKPEIPSTPIPIKPKLNETVSPDGFILKGSTFYDPDNDGHGASQWQVSLDSSDFSDPIIDRWIQYQNIYKENDLNKDIELISCQVYTLLPDKEYYWRLRYRDKGLNWSNWSAIESFKTDSVFLNWNLYPNPTTENAVLHIPYPIESEFNVNVYSQNGKIIQQYNSISPPVLTIEKNTLKKGTYLITISTKKEIIKTLKLKIL